MTSLQAEHDWLVEHHMEAERHTGRFIAILDQSIVVVGKTYYEVYQIAMKQHPGKIPLIIYVPKKGEELLIV